MNAYWINAPQWCAWRKLKKIELLCSKLKIDFTPFRHGLSSVYRFWTKLHAEFVYYYTYLPLYLLLTCIFGIHTDKDKINGSVWFVLCRMGLGSLYAYSRACVMFYSSEKQISSWGEWGGRGGGSTGLWFSCLKRVNISYWNWWTRQNYNLFFNFIVPMGICQW